MKIVHLNSFAALVNKRSEGSLVKAITNIVENPEVPFWYSRILQGVRKFFEEGLKYSVLESLVSKLDEVVPLTDFQKNDCKNSKLAVRKIQETSFALFDGKHLTKPSVKSIGFHGIELTVNPDALIFWTDDRGMKHVGVIKTKLKKSTFRQEEATMIACLLKYYLISLFPDYVVDDRFCICYDAFRSRFYTATNYARNLETAAALAERIAIMEHHAA